MTNEAIVEAISIIGAAGIGSGAVVFLAKTLIGTIVTKDETRFQSKLDGALAEQERQYQQLARKQEQAFQDEMKARQEQWERELEKYKARLHLMSVHGEGFQEAQREAAAHMSYAANVVTKRVTEVLQDLQIAHQQKPGALLHDEVVREAEKKAAASKDVYESALQKYELFLDPEALNPAWEILHDLNEILGHAFRGNTQAGWQVYVGKMALSNTNLRNALRKMAGADACDLLQGETDQTSGS